jgi:hypothetical protein
MTNLRYGIFLRPDPATCWAVTQITHALRQQFGIRAAEIFAPHATLIGNLNTDVSETELVAALDPVFEQTQPMTLWNHGVKRTTKGTYEYDVNLAADGTELNAPLQAVAAAVKDAVLPLAVRHTDYLAPNVEDYRFAGHLGLASFELAVDGRLSDEVGEFIAGLPVLPPGSFTTRYFTLFELTADDWNGHWWETQVWRHVRSWDTAPLVREN